MKKIITLLALLIVLFITGLWANQLVNSKTEDTSSLINYFQQNISTLSPVKETLGGKFYVTKVTAKDGAGVVYYEDGHNSYVADFGYTVDQNGVGRIEVFKIR